MQFENFPFSAFEPENCLHILCCDESESVSCDAHPCLMVCLTHRQTFHALLTFPAPYPARLTRTLFHPRPCPSAILNTHWLVGFATAVGTGIARLQHSAWFLPSPINNIENFLQAL